MVPLICNPADGELSPLFLQLGLFNFSQKRGMLLEITLGVALGRPRRCGFVTNFLTAFPGHHWEWDGSRSALGSSTQAAGKALVQNSSLGDS